MFCTYGIIDNKVDLTSKLIVTKCDTDCTDK